MNKAHLLTLLPLALAGCGAEDPGNAKFTTWGEQYIEQMIPPDAQGEAGFIDGWTLRYEKFLVAFHEITVADSKGAVAARMTSSKLVDNVKPGKKDLVTFPDLDAQAWDRVSYQVKAAAADAELVGASAADRDLMVAGGFSVYVAGSASKRAAEGPEVKKTFRWGFKTATQYRECQQEPESGHAIAGIVVTAGGLDTSELTTHGDHLYYDRLKAAPDPAVKTVLRFDEKAAADTNNDGEVTLDELTAAPIDVRKYDPSGFEAPNLGAFMSALSRTIGHFRGEGECTVSEIK